jgi:hypothetical protein
MKNIEGNLFQPAQPMDRVADAFILIVMYIAVCCVEAFEYGQLF